MSAVARARRVVALIGLAVVAFAVSPATRATAHSVVIAATPAPGATLRAAPPAVRIVFSEPLDAQLSGIDVYSSAGRRVPADDGRVASGDARAYVLQLLRLRPDRYSVVWHTVSAIDGHSRRGSYTFTLDRPDGSAPRIARALSPAVDVPSQPPIAGQAAAVWFALAGLFLLTGAVLINMLAPGTGLLEIPRVRRRLRRLAIAGVAAVVLGTAGEALAAWASTGWGAPALRALLANSAGHWWTVRLITAAAVAVGWRVASVRLRYLVPVAAALVVYSFAATSHGAATRGAVGLAFESAHILAASVWLGGAIALAAVWAAARTAGGGGRRTLLRRYSLTAGAAVPVLIASGLANAVLEVGASRDLVSSSYGRGLLIKLGVVGALLAVAAVNAVLLRPAADVHLPRGRHLGRSVVLEAALGIAVLVPTALLAVLAPSRPADAARAAAARISAQPDPVSAFSATTSLDGRDAEVSVTPAAAGANVVRAEVRGRVAASRLSMLLGGPGRSRTVELARTGYDSDPATHTVYAGSTRLDRAGNWSASLHRVGHASGATIVLPISASVSVAAAGDSDLTPVLALLAAAGGGTSLLAATRALRHRQVKVVARALAASATAGALAVAGTLAVTASGQPPATATWGQARTVRHADIAGARVWPLPAGAGLMMPAVDSSGSIWIAEMNVNKLLRLDPLHDRVQEFRFPGGARETMGIAVSRDGRIWLAQERAMALGMFDPRSGRYREFPIPGGLSAPLGLAVAPDGALWFTEMSGDAIGRFDPRTARFVQYSVPTHDAAPYWLALAPDGRVWFTEFGAGKVGVLDPVTRRVREYAVPGRPNIPAVALASDGGVWFSSIQGSLYRLSPSSGELRTIRLPAAGDYGIAVAPDGTLWVGRNGGRTMYAVQPANGRVSARRLPAGSAPWWPVVDPRGHVWAALAGAPGAGLAELNP